MRVVIQGNKPLGPNGENEQWPEQNISDVSPFITLTELVGKYVNAHGECSSIMVTFTDIPKDSIPSGRMECDHKFVFDKHFWLTCIKCGKQPYGHGFALRL